jgi:hypothetical protein
MKTRLSWQFRTRAKEEVAKGVERPSVKRTVEVSNLIRGGDIIVSSAEPKELTGESRRAGGLLTVRPWGRRGLGALASRAWLPFPRGRLAATHGKTKTPAGPQEQHDSDAAPKYQAEQAPLTLGFSWNLINHRSQCAGLPYHSCSELTPPETYALAA